RVAVQHVKQQARHHKDNNFEMKSPDQIKDRILATPGISGRALCIFIGLLIARTIAPNKEIFDLHWKTTDEGAIPRGCFGQYMKRDRFVHLSRSMHFSSNDAPQAATDRAWKLRPSYHGITKQFPAMLPSRSAFNRMWAYMKDKPHK
ncbi:hypothetical protein PC110_g23555, partial [Phytophthora cactorum]